MDDYNDNLAATLRFLFISSGLTYSQISIKTGIARATEFRVINGEREITVTYLAKLSKEFGVKPGELLNALEK